MKEQNIQKALDFLNKNLDYEKLAFAVSMAETQNCKL